MKEAIKIGNYLISFKQGKKLSFFNISGAGVGGGSYSQRVSNYFSVEKKGIEKASEENLGDFVKSIKKIGMVKASNHSIEPIKPFSNIDDKERTFTSHGEKLVYHYPIIKKYRETGHASIIRASLTLHQLCSSSCSYCSTASRNKSDSISLEEAKNFISKLYYDQAEFNKKRFPEYNDEYKKITGSDIRIQSVILTGGGQPNLWPHFEEFVDWLSSLDIELGLITNGFPKNIDENIYKKFTWIRLSITPENASPHYLENQFNNQYVPEFLLNGLNSITVGMSCVCADSFVSDDMLTRLVDYTNTHKGIEYLRLLADCSLEKSAQEDSIARINYRVGKFGKLAKKIFIQRDKVHSEDISQILTEDICFMSTYNVFWDTTGHDSEGFSYIYPCDSITVLENTTLAYKDSQRRFRSDIWGQLSNKNIENIYRLPHQMTFSPKEVCKDCLFTKTLSSYSSLLNTENINIEELSKKEKMLHWKFP